MKIWFKENNAFLLFITLAITTFLFLWQTGCNTTEPKDEVKPGRRDYVWTVDTLKDDLWIAERIWGTSPNDVWVVGSGSTSKGPPLFHYDGTKWTKPAGNFWDLHAIYGFDSNDVWAGGSEGWIYHYDGLKWNKFYQYKFDEITSVYINDIWGISPTNIYAVGILSNNLDITRGFVLHYNGIKWEEKYIAKENTHFLRIRSNNLSDKEYYIFGIIGWVDTTAIYSYKNGNMNLLFKKSTSYNHPAMIGNQIYIIFDNEVYALVKNELILRFTISQNNFEGLIQGKNFYDLFILVQDGLMHYNGKDYEYLFNINPQHGLSISDGLILDNQIFYGLLNIFEMSNYIYIGKLKGG